MNSLKIKDNNGIMIPMVKKLFLIVFFLAFFIFLPQQSIAQSDPLEDSTSAIGLSLPGVSCGNAESKTANTCCKNEKIDSIEKKVADSIPDFACLISIDPPFLDKIEGFCLSKIIEKPIGWLAKFSGIQKLLDLQQRSSPISKCINGDPKESGGQCTCVEAKASLKKLCDDYLKKSSSYNACVKCAGTGVYTGIGCIPTTPEAFASLTILRWPMGLAGGISFLCVLYSAFLLQTSRGNPERIKKAREYLTNCLIGLGVVLFSIFILRLIGVDILQIPGFS